MTPAQLQMLVGVSLLAGFFLSWLRYALRDFSRSKLDDVCRARNRPGRFGEILKQHEPAMLATELFLAVANIGLLGLTFSLLPHWLPQSSDFPAWSAFVLEVALIGLVYLLCLLILPWTLARVRGEGLIDRCWPLLRLLQWFGRPYLVFLRKIDRMFHRLTGVDEPREGDAAAISEEIYSVVEEGQREGIIEDEARSMIERVIELQDVEASSIMTPRTEIVTLSIDATFEEARRLMLEEGHSRVPVIGENTDDIRGILYAKDLLAHAGGAPTGFSLAKVVREPLYVPETTGVDSLLQTMKQQRVQMAIVLDEYGGVSGLVTMEDVLEEIVGEIDDEYDEIEEQGVEIVDERTAIVDGRMHLDELNELFGYDLPEEGDFDTIAGFVVSELGRIPEPGETLTWKQLRMTILEADKRRVLKLELEHDPTLEAIPTESE